MFTPTGCKAIIERQLVGPLIGPSGNVKVDVSEVEDGKMGNSTNKMVKFATIGSNAKDSFSQWFWAVHLITCYSTVGTQTTKVAVLVYSNPQFKKL